MLSINARFASQATTGVQRVAHELASRLRTPHRLLQPRRPLSGPFAHLWEQSVLPLRSGDDLLWSPCNTGPVLARNQIVTIHDVSVFDHPEWYAPNFVRLYRNLLPTLARNCRRVVTVSAYSRDRICHHFGLSPGTVEVIPNGIGPEFHRRPLDEVLQVQDRHGLTDQRYFLVLGTREPRKNLDLAIRAWLRLRGRIAPDFRLAVTGKMGSSRIFHGSGTQIPEDAGVHYLGYVDDALLPALISGAHALIYPSLYEGFGLPVAEAMACGTPAITTTRSSLPEVGGDAAIYVDPADPDSLAKTLLELAKSAAMRQEYGERGVARARRFDWDVAARQMDSVLEAAA